MKRRLVAMFTAVTLVLSMAGCGGARPAEEKKDTNTAAVAADDTGGSTKEASEGQSEEMSKEVKKMVTVLPNVRGDGGTHDLACRASEASADKIGAELDIIELGTAVTDSAKWEAAMSDLCEEDYDLIITGGSLMKDTIQTVAPMYPEIPFICYDVNLDFDSVDMPNVYAMDFHQNEAAYMAGVIAASMTKSNYIGFVGATKIPVIYDFMVGFISGAQAVNPDIKVAVAFTNDFNDATLAKELALAQIRSLPSVRAAGDRVEVSMYRYAEPSWTGLVYPTDCYFPTWVLPREHAACRAAEDAYRGLFGREPRIGKWTFSTNGVAVMGMFGIPVIGFGPGRESEAHAPDEKTWKDDLAACAALYAALPALYI